jgi:ferrous iron transport protein B
MSKMGLHGRSFVPMILGFGCNVPAVYATRSIESRSARLLTGLLIPFMSCSARLPVYVIFGLAFFPRHGSTAIMALYILGIVVAATVGMVLSRTVFRHAPAGILMMEMPPYRRPSPKRVVRYTWNETSAFVRKAGTFILLGTVVFWLLLNMPRGATDVQRSWFGRASNAVAPLLAPAGFGDWEASGALVTGLLAKEIVVSTLSQVYVGEAGSATEVGETPSLVEGMTEIITGFAAATMDAAKQLLDTFTPGISLFGGDGSTQDTQLTMALQSAFTPLSAFAFLVFVLLYVPCLATIGAQIQEFGWRWAVLSIGIMLVIPWVMATLIYQGGSLLGLG